MNKVRKIIGLLLERCGADKIGVKLEQDKDKNKNVGHTLVTTYKSLRF